MQINSGACVCFNVASQAGLGMLEAAAEHGVYAIGVDADQAEALAGDGKTDVAEHIVSSVLKNIDQVLLYSVQRHVEGTLPYGTEEPLGMVENAVGLADNETYYRAMTSEDMRAKIDELTTKINAGEIVVLSAFNADFDAAGYIASVAP